MGQRHAAEREGWLQYAARTADCVPLDRNAYPAAVYRGRPNPWPPWACRAPDGGVHKDNRIGQIDVHVGAVPKGGEYTWTCEFTIELISRRWLDTVGDLLDRSRTYVGKVFHNGEELPDWVTVHESDPPLLMMKRGWRKTCPICNSDYNVVYGGAFFSDPAVLERRVFVNQNGIFVRKEDVETRGIRPPVGAFKPPIVRYRPEWVALMRLNASPDYRSKT